MQDEKEARKEEKTKKAAQREVQDEKEARAAEKKKEARKEEKREARKEEKREARKEEKERKEARRERDDVPVKAGAEKKGGRADGADTGRDGKAVHSEAEMAQDDEADWTPKKAGSGPARAGCGERAAGRGAENDTDAVRGEKAARTRDHGQASRPKDAVAERGGDGCSDGSASASDDEAPTAKRPRHGPDRTQRPHGSEAARADDSSDDMDIDRVPTESARGGSSSNSSSEEARRKRRERDRARRAAKAASGERRPEGTRAPATKKARTESSDTAADADAATGADADADADADPIEIGSGVQLVMSKNTVRYAVATMAATRAKHMLWRVRMGVARAVEVQVFAVGPADDDDDDARVWAETRIAPCCVDAVCKRADGDSDCDSDGDSDGSCVRAAPVECGAFGDDKRFNERKLTRVTVAFDRAAAFGVGLSVWTDKSAVLRRYPRADGEDLPIGDGRVCSPADLPPPPARGPACVRVTTSSLVKALQKLRRRRPVLLWFVAECDGTCYVAVCKDGETFSRARVAVVDRLASASHRVVERVRFEAFFAAASAFNKTRAEITVYAAGDCTAASAEPGGTLVFVPEDGVPLSSYVAIPVISGGGTLPDAFDEDFRTDC